MGNGSQDTASRIAALLIARQAKLAVAESVTAGRIQALIATVSGASNFFEGGLVAYSLSQKVRLLGVDSDHAEAVNCVFGQNLPANGSWCVAAVSNRIRAGNHLLRRAG